VGITARGYLKLKERGIHFCAAWKNAVRPKAGTDEEVKKSWKLGLTRMALTQAPTVLYPTAQGKR